MLIVIAYPPPRRWWEWWLPARPILLTPEDYEHTEDGVIIHHPRRGWQYRIAHLMA